MKNNTRLQFNVTLNATEFETIQVLKKKYAINISGVFKLVLEQYREQLEKNKIVIKSPKIGE
jgi:hypothetical protein